MKTHLLDVLRCPSCGGAYRPDGNRLTCGACPPVPLEKGIPVLGPGYVADPWSENNPAPIGYHVIYRKAG